MPMNRVRTRRTPRAGSQLTNAAHAFFAWDHLFYYPDNLWARGRTEGEIIQFYQTHFAELDARHRAVYGRPVDWAPLDVSLDTVRGQG